MLQTHGTQFTIFTHSVLFSIFIILIHIFVLHKYYLHIVDFVKLGVDVGKKVEIYAMEQIFQKNR